MNKTGNTTARQPNRIPRPKPPTGRMDERFEQLWRAHVDLIEATERLMNEKDAALRVLEKRIKELEDHRS